MDIGEFNASLIKVQDGQSDLRSQFISEIQRLQSNIQKDVVQGSQGYVPIPSTFQQRSAFQMQSHLQISDYDDIIKQLTNEYTDMPTMRELMLSQLKKEQKYTNLPKYPEFYSDYIQGEILHNLNTPVMSPESVLTFLLEDEYANILKVKQQVLSCVNQLRYSGDSSKLSLAVGQLKRFFEEVRRCKDVIERVFSTSTAAFVKIPDNTIRKIQESGLQVNALNRGPSYITFDDFKRSLHRHLNNITTGQVLKLYVEHVQFLRRGYIINETMKLAGQLLYFKTGNKINKQDSKTENANDEDDLRLLPVLVSKELPDLLEQILNCEDFVDQFQLKDKFKQLLNVQLSGEVQQAIDANEMQQESEMTRQLPYNFQRIISIILSQLSEEKKVYGRSITQETLAAKLKACSHTYFKNLKFYFIQFFKQQKTEGEQDFNDIFDVIDAADRKAEHYEVVAMENDVFADLCVSQKIHQGIQRQFMKFFYEKAPQTDDGEPVNSAPPTTNNEVNTSQMQNSQGIGGLKTPQHNGQSQNKENKEKSQQNDQKLPLAEHAAQIFAWRDRLRSFDQADNLQTPNDKLTVICGLLVSITPQQREVLGEKYVEETIQKRLAVWDVKWCGKSDQIQQQLTQVAEFVRFVDINRFFSRMQEYVTAIFYYIQETKRLQLPINIFNEYGEREINNILDFIQLDNVDSNFQSNNLKEFLQKVTNTDFNWDKEWNNHFQINGYKLRNRKTGKQVIYQQAINYCQDLLYECNRVLSAYIEQIEKQLKRDYLIKTAYESDRFKIMHKDVGHNEIKQKLINMDNNQLMEYLSQQDIEYYKNFDFGSLIDITGIIQQYLKLETQYLYQKFLYVRSLFTNALNSGIQNVKKTVSLQINKFLYRPENLFEFSQATNALQEQGLFGTDPLMDRPMLDYLTESVAQVNSPLYILKLAHQTLELENSVINIFERQQEEFIQLQKRKGIISESQVQNGEFTFFEDVNLTQMLSAVDVHINDMMQIFTQEAYPHLFEQINGLRNQNMGENTNLSAYPGSGATQYHLKLPICLKRCFIEQIGVVVLQQMMQMQGNSIHTLPQHYQQSADLGQLQYPQRINFILEQAIKQLKIKADGNSPVNERVTSYGPERMVNSLLGLLSSQSVANQTETLRFRDFYQICEQGKKDQLDQYMCGCLFYTYDGVGALPLPFLVIARLHNLIHTKQRLQIEYIRSEILRKSSIRMSQSCQNSKVREDILTLYTRAKVTSSVKKQDYRQHLGPKLLQSSLPYMCSIDNMSCKYVLMQHDPYDTQNIIDALILSDADISASILEKPIQFSDVLPAGVIYPALSSTYQPGYLGILTRVSCIEKMINEVKFLNLQANMFQIDYALTNQAIRGELQAQLDESMKCSHMFDPGSTGISYEYFDQYDYLNTIGSVLPKIQLMQEVPTLYPAKQSTLYFSHVEDTIYQLTTNIQDEYDNKMKQYQAKEVTDQLKYIVSQSQIFIQCLNYTVEFVKRQALGYQVKTYLREFRTQIKKVDMSQHPFALEASPQYRGVNFSASDYIQSGFFLDDDGRVGHLSSIPHPALSNFDKFTVQMLEIVLFYCMNLQSVLKFYCLKQKLLGRQEIEYQIGQSFEFIQDISKIQVEDEDGSGVQNIVSTPNGDQFGLIIPSFVYLENEDLQAIKGAVTVPLPPGEGGEALRRRQQRQTAQYNLENVKVRLILSKLVLLRDCYESLQAAVFLQCYHSSVEKQHIQQAKYFKSLLTEKLFIQSKVNIIINDNDITEVVNMKYDGYKLSQALINNAEARSITQNLNTNVLQHQQQIEINKFYAGSGDQIQTHQYYNLQILTGCTEVSIKPIKEQTPAKFPYLPIKIQQNRVAAPETSQSSLSIPLPYLTYSKLKTINLTEINNFIQLQKLGIDINKNIVRYNGQLPMISYDQMQSAMGYSFCRYIPIPGEIGNNLEYDSSRRVCQHEITLDNKEIISQFFSTINQVLTQIELDSVFLNSILTALSSDKSQFNQMRYQLFICQNILRYNYCLSILRSMGLKKVNLVDFLGQKSSQKIFKQMFDKYIKQMPQPGSGHNLNNQQVIANINAKKKQQLAFLQENFFEYVDEKNIEALFVSDDCQGIRESLYYMQYAFANLFQQNLVMFQQFQLLEFLKEKNYMLEFKLAFQEKFNSLQNISSAVDSGPELTEQFIAYQDNVLKLGQWVCTQLQQYCRIDATLNPFNSNVTSQLTPQIISVFNGINQLQSFNFKPGQTSFQNSQRLAGVKAMLSILHNLLQKEDTSKLTNIELRNYNNQQKYLGDVVAILSQQQNLFYSFVATKMVFELKRSLSQDFEKYQLYTSADDKNQLLKIFKTSTKEDQILLQQQIYGYDVKSIINQLNRLYNNIYNPSYQDLKAYQDEQNYDRLKVYGHISIYNQSIILNQQLPKSIKLQQQIIYKSIFSLYNQANIAILSQISQRQRELYYVMNQLIVAEDMQRQNIHNTYQTKFLTVLAAIISIQELQKIFEQSKNDISNQSVDEIKAGYQKIQIIQDQLVRFCICKNYTQDFLAGLKDINIKYDKVLDQYDAFDQNRQNIIQNYNSSIKITKDNLADIKLRSLMSRNYLNNIIKYKSEQLEEISMWTNDAISGYSRGTYQLIAEIQTTEEELEKQINVVQQIINEKTANVLEMKEQLVNSKKTRQGTGSTTTKEQAARVQLIKEQANQIVQNNFQGKKQMKTLPILANNGLQKAYKICNQGEELVAIYRQKLIELETLKQQKSKLEENIRLNANFYINEQNSYKREINKEKEIIRQAQAQQMELTKSNNEFIKQIQLAQRLQQENTKMMYNNKIQKLHDEKKKLMDEETEVNLRIEKLFNNPKHRKLFDAVGQNMDQVLTYFEQLNNRGIGSRATTNRGPRF